MNMRTTKFLQRCLVYGSLLGCVAALAWSQRAAGDLGQAWLGTAASHLSGTPATTPTDPSTAGKNPTTFYYNGPMQGHAGDRRTEADAEWHRGVAALDQPVELHLTNVTVSQAVATIAKTTGLNLVCFDGQGDGRLSLQVSRVPLWQAMQAVADASGGRWRRDADVFMLRTAQAPGLTEEKYLPPKPNI